MEYLGLGPDDAYDDYDDVEPEPQGRQQRSSRAPRDEGRTNRSSTRGWGDPDSEEVRTVPARPSFPSRDFDASRRTANDDAGTSSRTRPSSGSSRREHTPSGSGSGSSAAPSSTSAEPATVRPRRFDQAQELADRFKEGNAVILNLESADRDVARRLIDFASGVCYSLDGTMEKVATGVYLLKPAATRSHRFDDFDG